MITDNKDLKIALKAARAGAYAVMEGYGKNHGSRIKEASKSIVTDTDIEAERAILGILGSESDYGILSEESGSTGKDDGPKWIVDPLDGTSNFARYIPLFAVSVALMEGPEILAGVIIDPVNNVEYSASKNEGAYCNGDLLLPLHSGNQIPAVFVNHGHRQEDRLKFGKIVSRLSDSYNLRKFGTTALELCYVAGGMTEGFICSGDEIWDFAAGVLIASEAGCVFSDWQGRPWNGQTSSVIVARPDLHEDIVRKISDLQ